MFVFKFAFVFALFAINSVQVSSQPTGNDLAAISGLITLNPGSALLQLPGWSEADPTSACLPSGFQGVICYQNKIVVLDISSVGFVNLPAVVFNMTDLFLLNVSNNGIVGTLPNYWRLGENREQVSVDLSGNSFSGSIPSRLSPKITTLKLNKNALTGAIPSSISTLTGLWTLDVSKNQLTGSVPSSLGSISSLQNLNLSRNQLTGSLPVTLEDLTQLQTFDVSFNRFTGTFPNFDQSVNLETIWAQNNSFTGLVPQFLKGFSTDADFAGSVFRCPIPSCQSGVQCVLSTLNWTCTCPCTALSYCVVDTPYCVCPSTKYGSRCEATCPGTSGSSVCSGNGNCSSGYAGSGTCSCQQWWGSADCSRRCPGLSTANNNVTTACNNFGVCNSEGSCVCSGNRTGVDCVDCQSGYAGVNCDRECDGGFDNPCNGHGDCSQGTAGSGICNCYDGWQGSACDKRDRNIVGLAVALSVIALAAILLALLIVYVKRNEIRTRLIYNKVDKKKDDPKVADYS